MPRAAPRYHACYDLETVETFRQSALAGGARDGLERPRTPVVPQYQAHHVQGNFVENAILEETAPRGAVAPGQDSSPSSRNSIRAFWHMQAVLRLVPHDALRAVDDFTRDFLAAVRRQAMHEDRIGSGHCHHVGIDAPVREGGAPLLVFRLVAHAGPDIGRDQVRSSAGFHRILELPQHRCRGRASAHRIQLVAGGRRYMEREAQHFSRLQPGIGHVVGVADPRHDLPGDRAAMLYVGEDIRQDLAGVEFIGQAVDDRYAGMCGEAFDAGLLEGADHHDVHHARNNARGVFDGFGASQLRIVGREIDDGSAQLIHPRFERHACARARLLENHRQRAVMQRHMRVIALELVLDQARALQHIVDFGGGKNRGTAGNGAGGRFGCLRLSWSVCTSLVSSAGGQARRLIMPVLF